MNRLNKITTVEESFENEVANSERLRTVILIVLLAVEAFFLLIIYLFYKDEYLIRFNNNIAIFAIFIFTILLIFYQYVVHHIINKGNYSYFLKSKTFVYINSFFEISLLTGLLIYIVNISNQTTILLSPATLTYFIFIILSIFRLDIKLSIFTGILAAIEFILISIYYSTYYASVPVDLSHPDLLGMQYLGQGLVMAITGIAAGFVADLIRKRMKSSWENIKEKNEVISLFGQQISKKVAENLITNHKELTGVRKKVSIMFLDLRDFSPFVEKHQPEQVVKYLNTLFSFMIEIIEKKGGIINQFLGDGFMATFGAPVTDESSSQNAVSAAIEIIERLRIENESNRIPFTKIGIGIHYDEAVTGNIGSSIRKQFSITGKVVIVASRIEQLNKTYDTNLLISKEVYHQLVNNDKKIFEELGSAKIKGSAKNISLYRLVDKKATIISEENNEYKLRTN